MTDDTRPALKPANENPWYLLATLYGEQREESEIWNFDRDLANRNRRAWNRWMCAALTDEQRTKSSKANLLPFELTPLSDSEELEFISLYAKRAGDPNARPDNPRAYVDFRQIIFHRPISFSGYVFPAITFFERSIFMQDVDFSETTFHAHADFTEAEFSRSANFNSGSFFDSVTFSGCKFCSATIFADTTFENGVPDFRDSTLREYTVWQDSRFPTAAKDYYSAIHQIYGYQRLKAEMERLKKHEDEQFFFAKELRARRVLLWFDAISAKRRCGERLNDVVALLSNGAYDLFGSYGLSIIRPIFWLILSFTIGFVVFATTNSLNERPMDPWDAAGLSATNLISLLPYKPDKFIIDHLSPAAKIIGNLQSIFGLILLFLLGLALRNRFRMK